MDLGYYKRFEPIDGKWYITRELGRGAYGVVFEVERRDFSNEKCALKIVSIPSSQSEVASYREENYNLDEQSITSYFYGYVEEFTKEFQLMYKLRGESNIVSIEDYDVVKRENEVGWDIFIRMELLTPMNKYFSTRPLNRNDIIKLGTDMCKALEVCQKFNIIHRDIKPSNIFVSETGNFKLGDFGVARTLEKTSSGLSKKGTYTYMAPEVYTGAAYNSNVDIYSLGIVLYKLLNNNFEPFRTGNTHTDEENALIRRLKGEIVPPPANADAPLARIIAKALSFNPADRYQTPAQMRADLEALTLAPGADTDAAVNYTADKDTYEPTASPFGNASQPKAYTAPQGGYTATQGGYTAPQGGFNQFNAGMNAGEATRGIFDTPPQAKKQQTSAPRTNYTNVNPRYTTQNYSQQNTAKQADKFNKTNTQTNNPPKKPEFRIKPQTNPKLAEILIFVLSIISIVAAPFGEAMLPAVISIVYGIINITNAKKEGKVPDWKLSAGVAIAFIAILVTLILVIAGDGLQIKTPLAGGSYY